MTEHLTRRELIEAARGESKRFDEHLSGCDECSSAVELLRVYNVVGKLKLSSAPEAVIQRAVEIDSRAGLKDKARSLIARLSYDSWSAPHPVGVRGSVGGAERRIRFEHDDITLDLRAEKDANQWSFVATIYSPELDPVNVRLRVGRTDLDAGTGGIYSWTSRRPPRVLTIVTEDAEIETPELRWQKKKK